jgi:hydroxymethylpyrimidine/phosphomethylpyrimidine kinase
VYGTVAITAVTAQNTLGVRSIHELPPEAIAEQIDAVLEDIGADATKTGMLRSTAAIATIVDRIRYWGLDSTLVVDPIMLASSGDRLFLEDAMDALVRDLLPLARIVTPNLPEAEVLVGRALDTQDDVRQAARDIIDLGPRAVVITGGHGHGGAVEDVLFDGTQFHVFGGERLLARQTHGTGCTFSAAIAAQLARGAELVDAVRAAKTYVSQAIRAGLALGGGSGPVGHPAWSRAGQ